MKLDLKFVELHAPLFIEGMNFGLKLYADPKKNKAPITMWYDTDLKHVLVLYKNEVSLVGTVASMTLATPSQVGVELSAATPKTTAVRLEKTETTVKAQVAGPGVGLRHTAQVSDPTRQAPKTVLRKAKYQGEESQGE